QILADAKSAAEQERQRAVREIELAADREMQRLAELSANTAAQLAGKVIQDTVTPEKQAELVRQAMTQLTGPSSN
ncbi:MAG: hypothetical protein AAF961_08745, partial [Planctomycetota bacterium]